MRYLNRYVKGSVGLKWHDLGIELLDFDDVDELDKIKSQHSQGLDEECKAMFQLWLKKQPSASWNQLIEALRQPGIELKTLASKVEQMLLKPKPKPGWCMSSLLTLLMSLALLFTCVSSAPNEKIAMLM